MGDLLCLDSATGRVVWQKNFVRDYGAEAPLYGFASPPLVDGDRLITMVGGQGQAVVALDRHTGRELWKAGSASEPGYCAPLIRTLAGKRQLVVWHADALVGLEPSTGKLLWSIPHPLMAGMAISTPAVEGNRLAVSSQYEGTMMLEFKPGAEAPSPLEGLGRHGAGAAVEEGGLQHHHEHGAADGAATSTACRSTARRAASTATPAGGSGPRFSQPAAVTVPRERWSTLFMVPHGDKVFIFNEKGDLILARLTPAGYDEISRRTSSTPTCRRRAAGAARWFGRIPPLPTAAFMPATTTRSLRLAGRTVSIAASGSCCAVVVRPLGPPPTTAPDERPMPRIPSTPPVVPAGNATIRFSAADPRLRGPG